MKDYILQRKIARVIAIIANRMGVTQQQALENGRRYALLRGRGYQNKGGQATKKYLDENPGSPITSLWDDDNLQLNTSSAERIGYFYGLSSNHATLTDICDHCQVSLSALTGDLFA